MSAIKIIAAGALLKLAEELREFTAMKYAGDCKCGKCQLVPRELVERIYHTLNAASHGSAGGERSEVRSEEAIGKLIQRHASAYVARGAAISDSIIDECKASREALLAAFSAAQEAKHCGVWQPIETAPHGKRVLLGWHDWRDHQWCVEVAPATTGQRYGNGYSTLSQHGSATHWQPLPEGPATPSAQLGGPRCTCARADVNLSQSVPHAPGCPMGDR